MLGILDFEAGFENSLQFYSNKYQTPQQRNQNCSDRRYTTAEEYCCKSSANFRKISRMVIGNQKLLVG